jgi:hypothetical protein
LVWIQTRQGWYDKPMSVLQLYRWAGIAGLFAAVLNAVVELLPAHLGGPLNLFVSAAGLWVLSALYLRQRQPSGLFGLVSYLIHSFGMTLVTGLVFAQVFVLAALDPALVASLMAGPTGIAALSSFAIFILGVILFGISLLRANVFPKWAAVLYILGFLLVAAGLSFSGLLSAIGEVTVSIALLGLSVPLIWDHSATRAPNPQNLSG